ncbi:hypothetical protein F5876DRAFT_74065 [Lentinula aff. lateritia]|uniref:Uncharacterized protein n=1 Tax=Lentinula aff. lateritia TaxID=2804960 RepID=A0ACC1U8Y5_9AGAR|nr:hypothetical protein F5876DRAFT_74065 [Lentinula aff. lateritia]
MHRQAFFSLIVAVIALCAALSIAAPTSGYSSSPCLPNSPKPEFKHLAPRTKPKSPPKSSSKAPAKPAAAPPTPKKASQPAHPPKAPTSSLNHSCPVKDKTRKKITKGRSIKLEGRTPNPGTTLCDVPIRENVECTGRPSPLEHVKRRSPPDSSGSEYVPSSDSSEHSSEDEDANLLECEHAVELQLLAFTFSNNGYCAALDDLVALSGIGKDAYLADIKTAINQKTNLYNIPKDTNAAKNHITTKFKAGNGASNAATAPFDPENVIQWGRVKTYLNTAYVSSNAATLVKSIDTKATTLLQKARLDAENCQASQTKIDSAKAKFEPSEGTMVTIWENYVKYVTTQAEVKK